MATNYTVVLFSRQHLGNEAGIFNDVEPNVVFVGRAGSGPVINARVFDSTGGCDARGTDNMQMRFASGRPHATICPAGNGPIGPSRFIHIEQRRTVRRAPTDRDATPGVNRTVVVNGIVATFP